MSLIFVSRWWASMKWYFLINSREKSSHFTSSHWGLPRNWIQKHQTCLSHHLARVVVFNLPPLHASQSLRSVASPMMVIIAATTVMSQSYVTTHLGLAASVGCDWFSQICVCVVWVESATVLASSALLGPSDDEHPVDTMNEPPDKQAARVMD